MTILDTSEYGLLNFFAWVAQLVERLICYKWAGREFESLHRRYNCRIIKYWSKQRGGRTTVTPAKEGRRIPGD